ncbi:MAG: transglycosylase domain-containing protein [Negativicutes bacterium]|nr:transglycosylase domain-containing protein [Negativicutes bacterium]
MRSRKFIWLMALLFAAAFLWAGGGSIFRKFEPETARAKSAAVQAVGVWDRVYRVIALKSAVEAKLDRNKYVKLEDIPLSLQQAIIAVEDNRFYRHYGFDIEGILRAALVNLQTGALVEGGSTITQQLVRNLFLSQEKTFGRKFEEVILAINMELRYSKEEILEMYLNTIYFGSGAYGIGDAAKVYFGKRPAELTLAQSAMLAGLPNAPSALSPLEDLEAAKQRQAVVLAAMVRHSYIGPKMAQEARQEPLRLRK